MQNELVKTYKKMMMEKGRESRYPYAFGMIQGALMWGKTPEETVEKIRAIITAFEEAWL